MNQRPDKMPDLKPWKSVAEQLAILKGRGLQVDNEPVALNYLARIGYYRLSGYWYPEREINTVASQQQQRSVRTDRFVTDSHFEDVAYLLGKKDPYPFMYFAMMAHLLTVICPSSSWVFRLVELLHSYPVTSNGALTLDDFGVCNDWEGWLLRGQI